MHQINPYLHYLKQSQKTKLHQSFFAGQPICEKLLGLIAIETEAGKPYTVSEIMRLQNLGSPGTIHRRLEILRRAGLVDQVFKNGDRRTRYVVPTTFANRYFKCMGSVMEQAVLDARLAFEKDREDAHKLNCLAFRVGQLV